MVECLGAYVGIQFILVSWHSSGFIGFKIFLCVLQVSFQNAKCPAVFKAKKWYISDNGYKHFDFGRKCM